MQKLAVNNLQFEFYGLLVDELKAAISDCEKDQIFQIMVWMRKRWPSECNAWEQTNGPSY